MLEIDSSSRADEIRMSQLIGQIEYRYVQQARMSTLWVVLSVVVTWNSDNS